MSTHGINNLIPLVWILFSTRLLILISTVSLHETNPEAARCVSVRTYDHMLSHVFTTAPKTPLSQHARSGQISRNVFLGGGGYVYIYIYLKHIAAFLFYICRTFTNRKSIDMCK